MSQTIDVKRYEELARQKQGEHRKFLAQLKKKAPKNLDKIVQQVHNEVFQEIDCTQCANCCKTLRARLHRAGHYSYCQAFSHEVTCLSRRCTCR